jgi:hypothetical protein
MDFNAVNIDIVKSISDARNTGEINFNLEMNVN